MKVIFSGASGMLLLLKASELELYREFRLPDLTAFVRDDQGRLITYTMFVPMGFGSFGDAIHIQGECAQSAHEVSFFWSPDEEPNHTDGRSYLESIELTAEPGELTDSGEVVANGRLDRLFKQAVGRWRELPDKADLSYRVEL